MTYIGSDALICVSVSICELSVFLVNITRCSQVDQGRNPVLIASSPKSHWSPGLWDALALPRCHPSGVSPSLWPRTRPFATTLRPRPTHYLFVHSAFPSLRLFALKPRFRFFFCRPVLHFGWISDNARIFFPPTPPVFFFFLEEEDLSYRIVKGETN